MFGNWKKKGMIHNCKLAKVRAVEDYASPSLDFWEQWMAIVWV